MPKKKNSASMQPAQIRWEFGPDIPTHDFFEGGCLDETWSLQEAVDGLGQEEDVTLEDPEEHYRIEWIIDHLRECKESVAYFDINLESLLNNVILPAKDQPIFLAMMQHGLGLSSAKEPLACRL